MSALPCPCGSGAGYAECCKPLMKGEREATTCVELMRSRYTAYVRRDVDYILRTWDPATRPTRETLGDLSTPAWRGLEVGSTSGGNPDDAEGKVTFTAYFEDGNGQRDAIRETSTFTRLDGRWVYVDGHHFD
ncbi:YchJ family protein [Demequina sediminicola]|uniref:YchJ family protein n=1 Tax=Demequina sediminicola TaxID=1095026 RepID=UPI000A4D9E88